MPPGEKRFVRGCYEIEIEEKDKLMKKGISCPYFAVF